MQSDENDYITPEIIPLSIQDKLSVLAQESGVDITTILNAYKHILSGIDRNTEGRFDSVLQATTFQLQEYVKRNKIRPGKKAEKDKHTPAQVRHAEMLYMKLVSQNRKG